MHVLILGSGVIMAYYLAHDGHQVTVVDRQPARRWKTRMPARVKCRRAIPPWAGPGVPLKAIKWMLMHHSPLVISRCSTRQCGAGACPMLRNCTESRYRVNKARMVRLAEYSRDCLKELRTATGIAYDERTGHAGSSVPRSSSTASARMSTSSGSTGCLPGPRGRRLPRVRAALALVKHKSWALCACRGDETGDCFQVHQEPPGWPRATAPGSASA